MDAQPQSDSNANQETPQRRTLSVRVLLFLIRLAFNVLAYIGRAGFDGPVRHLPAAH